MESLYRSSRCFIDLRQFRANLEALLKEARVPALLVVKANAYGHGIVQIAREAVATGVAMLGVATIGEAEAIRLAGVHGRILVMAPMDDIEIRECIGAGLEIFAWSPDHVALAEEEAARRGLRARLHLKVDTGMHRMGVRPDCISEVVESLRAARCVDLVGVATHFVAADTEDALLVASQLMEFNSCVAQVRAAGLTPTVHAANSPAAIRFPEARFDMVRLGVIAYGLLPAGWMKLPSGVGPALTWKAKVVNVGRIEACEGVSYGWEYRAKSATRVATIAVGYADGWRRAPKNVNVVALRGRLARVIGRVCMDQCVLEVPSDLECACGDDVVLLGRQDAVELSAEAIAERWGTNNYDVVCGIRSRVPRVYC